MVLERKASFKYLKPILYVGVFFVIGFIFFAKPNVNKVFAKACTSAGSGDWTTSTTWTATNSCNVSGGPIAGDTITIASGHTVTISTAVAAASVVINNAGAVTGINMTGGSLALSSTLTCNAPSTNATTTIAVGARTLSAAGISLSGGTQTKICALTLTTGTLTTTAGLTFGGTVAQTQFSNTGAGTINIAGTMSGLPGTFTINSGTTTHFTGTSAINSAYTFGGPVTLDTNAGTTTLGAGTITFSGALTVNSGATLALGNVAFTESTTSSISGSVTATGSTGTYTFTGAVTVNSGGSFDLSGGSHATTFSGGITHNGTTFNAGAGASSVGGTNAFAGSSNMTFGGAVAAGTLTNNNTGVVTITGVLSGTSFTQGTTTNTLKVGATPTVTTLTASGTNNTVEYTFATPTCKAPATNYYNLVFSGASGAVTCAQTTTAGSVTVSGGVTWTPVLTTVSGNFTVSGTAVVTTGANLAITGTLNVNGGSFKKGAFTLGVTSTTTVAGGTLTVTSATGATTFTGAVAVNSGTFDYAATNINAAATFRGGLSVTSGATFTSGTNTFTFDTNDQNISGTGAITFSGPVTMGTAAKTVTNLNSNTVTIVGAITLTGNWTQGASSTLSISTANAFSGAGTFDASTNANTVIYTAVGPTCKSVNYSSITFSGASGAITCAITSASGNVTSSGGETWTAVLTTIGGNLALSGTATFTTGASLAISGTLTVGNGTTFTQGNTFTLTVTGTTTIGAGTSGTIACSATAGTRTLNGDLTINAGATYNKTNCGTLTFSKGAAQVITDNTSGQDLGTVTTATSSTSVSTATGIKLTSLTVALSTTWDISNDTMGVTGSGTPLSVSGTLTLTSSTVDYSSASDPTILNITYSGLTISGTVTSSNTFTVAAAFTVSGTFTPSAGTVTLNNGASISNSGTLTFFNVTLANSATVTTSASFTVGGALTVGTSANLSPSSGTITFNNGASISNSGTLVLKGLTVAASAAITTASSFSVDGALTVGAAGSFTASAGTITRNGTTWTTSNSGTLTYYSLTWAGDPVTEPASSFTVSSVFTINTGITVQPSGGTITLSGSGTPFVVSGTALFNPSGGTVVYNGTSATTVIATRSGATAGAAYRNLTLSPAATVTYTMGDAINQIMFVIGDFIGGNGTNALTIDWSTYNTTLDWRGDFTLKSNALWTKGTGLFGPRKAGTQILTDENSSSPRDLGKMDIDGGSTVTLGSNIKIETLNIATGNVLDVTASNYGITVTGSSWTNTDSATSFLAHSGTVTFTTTATVAFTGATTFNSIAVSSIGAAKILTFQASTIFTFTGTFTITGASGQLVTIQSSSAGTQWKAHFNSAQSSVTYASVKDSGCDTGTAAVTLDATSPNVSGNDTSCWSFPVTSITVSGTLFNSDESTFTNSATALVMAVGGSTQYTATSSAANGTWSFTNVTAPAAGTIITIWTNVGSIAGTNNATLVFRYGSSCTSYPDCTGLQLFKTRVIFDSKDGSNLNVSDLAACDNDSGTSCTDTDIGFTENTSILTGTWTTRVLRIKDSTAKFNLDATVTFGGTSVQSAGTVTLPAATSVTFTTATYSLNGGTITLSGTLLTFSGNLVANGGTVNVGSATLRVSGGTFTVSGGTINGDTGTIDINNGNFSMTSGTFTMGSGGMQIELNFTLSGGTFNNSYSITFNDASSAAAQDSTITCTGSLPGTVVLSKTDLSGTASDVTVATGCSISLGSNPTSATASLINNGTITTSGAGTWTVNLSPLASIANNATGTITAGNTGGWDINDGSFNNLGIITYAGTTINVEGGFNQSGTFDLTGITVTLDNTGADDSTITCSGTMGGTIVFSKTAASGTSDIIIDAGCSINLGASPSSIVEGTLTNNGTIVVASGTWTYTGIEVNPIFTNNGTITHTGLTPGWDINEASLTNNGTINYGGTDITIEESFTQAGTFNLSGKIITFDTDAGSDASTISCTGSLGGTVVINKGTSSSGVSSVTISAGCTVDLGANPTLITAANGTNSNIVVNGTLTASGNTSWIIKTVSANPSISTVVTVNSGGTLSYTGTGSWSFQDITLSNLSGGTVTFAGTVLNFDRSITQSGTFDLTGKTINIIDGTSSVDITTITCTGNLGGTFNILRTGSSNSPVTIAAGCSVTLDASPTSTMGLNAALTVAGTIVVPSGTWTINNNGTNSTTLSIVVSSGGTITHNGTGWDINDGGLVINSGGTVTYSGDLLIERNLTNSGTFDMSAVALTLEGTTSSDLATLICTGSSIGSLIINKSSATGTTVLASDCTIIGSFTRTDGPLSNPGSAFNFNIGGNFSTSTTDILGGANQTFTFNGSSAQTITQNATPTTNTSLFVINKTNATDTVTLASNLVLGSTLTITKGVFDQGATFNLTTGAITVGATGTWNNTGTGDVTLSGNVSNAGIINLDGSGVGCGGADAIALTSNTTAQRVWSGAGTFTLYDLTVSWMGGSMTTNSSTNTGTGTSDLGSGAWTFSACAGGSITISGTIYQNDGTTVYNCSLNTLTVAIKVNGAGTYTSDCTGSGGTYSIGSITISAPDDVVMVFLDGETEKAVTVTKVGSTSTNITDMYLYQNRVAIRTETNASAMTNANLNQYDSACSAGAGDTDIQFCSDGTNLTVADGSMLLIFDNATTTTAFTPGGTVTTDPSADGTDSVVDGDLIIQSGATLTMATNALSIGGDYNNAGTMSVTSPHTTTYTATSTGFSLDKSGSGNMDDVTFNGTGGEWTYNYNSSPTGNVTVTAGTLKIGSATLTVAATKTLSVGASGILHGGSGTVNLTGTGTPLSISGTFTPSTGTVKFSGTSAAIAGTIYNNLTLGGTGTYTLPASDVTLRGNLVVTTGAAVVKSNANKIIFAIGAGSSQTLTGNATNSDLGIIQVSANSGATTLNLGSSVKVTSLTVDASQTLSLNGSNTLTFTATGTGASRPFVNNGNFTASTGTVEFVGNGNTDIESNADYYDLLVDPTVTSNYSFDPVTTLNVTHNYTINPTTSGAVPLIFTLLRGNIVVGGTLTVQRTGTGTALNTVDTNNANNYSLTVGALNLGAKGSLNARASTVTITGSGTPIVIDAAASFLVTTSSFVFSGTSSTNITAATYGNLSFSPASSATYTLPSSDLTLRGNLVVGSNTTITKGSGTIIFAKGSTGQTWTDNTGSSQDIGAVQISANTTATTLNLASNVKATSLTVDASQTFAPNGTYTLDLTGTGTPFVVSGTFTPSTGTIKYSGSTATVTATTYNDLTLGGTGTYTMPATTTTLRGNLAVASTGTVTKGAGTIVFAIGGAGTQTITDNAATKSDLGAVQISANSGNSTLNMGSDIKVTSLTIDASQVLSANGTNTLTFTGNGSSVFVVNGTFTPSTGTVAFVPAATTGVTIPLVTYYGLTLNKAANTFTSPAGTLAINGNLAVTAGTFDLNTNDPTVTVSGTTTIDGTLSASNTNALTIKNDWTNNGTFTHNSGTVIVDMSALDRGSALTMGGTASTQTFYNFTSTTGARTLKFKTAASSPPQFNFNGTINLTGTSEDNLNIASTIPGTQWLANIDSAGNSSLNFITVKDSGCVNGTLSFNVNDTVLNLGNNGTCWSFAVRGGGGAVGGGGNGGASGGGSGVGGGGSGGSTGGDAGSGGGTPTGGGGQGGGGGTSP